MAESAPFKRPTAEENADENRYGLTNEEKYQFALERSQYNLEQRGVDTLTGIKTRGAFQEELEHMLRFVGKDAEAHRAGIEPIQELSLLFIDLDNFGQVNKIYGHAEGDNVLKKAVEAIKRSVRESDILGRFGGDEFLVLLPRATVEKARERAEGILKSILDDEELKRLNIGASIGVSSSLSSVDPKGIMDFADEAAKKAKQGGKNRVIVAE